MKAEKKDKARKATERVQSGHPLKRAKALSTWSSYCVQPITGVGSRAGRRKGLSVCFAGARKRKSVPKL